MMTLKKSYTKMSPKSDTISNEKKEDDMKTISNEKKESDMKTISNEKKESETITNVEKKDTKNVTGEKRSVPPIKRRDKNKLKWKLSKPLKRLHQMKFFTEGPKLDPNVMKRRRYMLKNLRRALKTNETAHNDKILKRKHEQIFKHLWRAHWQMDNAMFLLSKLTENQHTLLNF